MVDDRDLRLDGEVVRVSLLEDFAVVVGVLLALAIDEVESWRFLPLLRGEGVSGCAEGVLASFLAFFRVLAAMVSKIPFRDGFVLEGWRELKGSQNKMNGASEKGS